MRKSNSFMNRMDKKFFMDGPTKKRSLAVLVFILFITLTNFVRAEGVIHLPRLSGPIKLDGISDEIAWQSIEPLPLTMSQPTFRGELTERTEIRVAYDNNFLYVSGCLYDSDPGSIRANSLYRDRWSRGDTLDIILDTFNDNQHALWFRTNPAGIRVDCSISGDGNSFNLDWNTYGDVVTVQNQEGWFTEMRIPFSSLGFQEKNGDVIMGLTACRYISRTNERYVYPEIPPKWEALQPSKAQDVLLKGVTVKKPVYVTPYVVGGFGQTAALNDSETVYKLDNNVARDIGLDVKWNLTSNLTLDATVNTDFAQVEADDQVVNLTRFSIFFPEKRQFFQERSGIFAFNTGTFSSDRLFHSRTIGLYNGNSIPILGGLRLVGRSGGWDIGLLDMQTARSEGHPAENFGVLRLRRQVFNPYSYIGGMVTSRVDEDGGYNIAYGLDGIFRLFGDYYLSLMWAQTFEDDIIKNEEFDFAKSALFRVQWYRQCLKGLNYRASVSWSGPDFQPGMGFATREDLTELSWNISYNWFKSKRSTFRRISPMQFFGFVALRNSDHTVESALFEYDLDFEKKSGAGLGVDFELYYENLPEPICFKEGTVVPVGDYTFFNLESTYYMGRGRSIQGQFAAAFGQFYDGWRLVMALEPAWYISRHFELSGVYELNIIRFPGRDQGFDSHILRLRVRSALNTKASLNAVLQYNSLHDIINVNARFRYNFREGQDLWLVYNQGINTDRYRIEPALLGTNDRTVMVKYTYTFNL